MDHKKPTKNILTREEIKKVLRREAKGELSLAALGFALVTLIFLPCFIAGIYVATFVLLLGIALSAVCVLCIAFMLYRLIVHARVARMIGRDGFSVVTDTLCRTAKEPVGRRGDLATVYYFSAYGKGKGHHGSMALAEIGDPFYLVVLDDKKKSVRLTYPAAEYDYVEEKK